MRNAGARGLAPSPRARIVGARGRFLTPWSVAGPLAAAVLLSLCCSSGGGSTPTQAGPVPVVANEITKFGIVTEIPASPDATDWPVTFNALEQVVFELQLMTIQDVVIPTTVEQTVVGPGGALETELSVSGFAGQGGIARHCIMRMHSAATGAKLAEKLFGCEIQIAMD